MNENRTIENRTIAADGTIADSLASKYRTFETLTELIEHVKNHTSIYYHAPMDVRPALVSIRQYTISHFNPEVSRITIWTPETKTLVFHLMKHFDRFRTVAPKGEVKA